MTVRTEATTPTDAPNRTGLIGHFGDPDGARRALEALDARGIPARRVERSRPAPQPGPTVRQWAVGGGLGVLVGALVGGVIGLDAASVPGSPDAGVPAVAALLGAFVLGTVGLFAAYAWGRSRARRGATASAPARRNPPETLVYAEVPLDGADAVDAAFREAGARDVDTVRPGEDAPRPGS